MQGMVRVTIWPDGTTDFADEPISIAEFGPLAFVGIPVGAPHQVESVGAAVTWFPLVNQRCFLSAGAVVADATAA